MRGLYREKRKKDILPACSRAKDRCRCNAILEEKCTNENGDRVNKIQRERRFAMCEQVKGGEELLCMLDIISGINSQRTRPTLSEF